MERIDFEENGKNICNSVTFTFDDKGVLNLEAENSDYYAHGVSHYTFSEKQVEQLKNFLVRKAIEWHRGS